MVYVIARAELREGAQAKFLEVLNANIPTVRAEKGCIRYEACLDTNPETRDRFVTIMETWESEADLKAHLGTPHMAAYRLKVKDLRLNNTVTVVQPQ